MNSEDKVCYVFPGQGSQSKGMGKELYEKYDFVKKIFDIGNEILGYNITNLMFNGPEEELKKTIHCQPAILLNNMAHFYVLREKVPCSLNLGHSIGEYSALAASEVISWEDSISLAKERAKLMSKCIPKEKVKQDMHYMAAVLNNKPNLIDLVKEACDECSSQENIVQIANINSSSQIIISGNNNALVNAVEYLKNEKNIKRNIIYLKVEGPFHSDLMKPAAEGMRKALKNIKISKPKIPYISNLNGDFITEPDEIKESLVGQIYKTVQWEKSLKKAIRIGFKTFIESGSGEKQSNLLKRDYKEANVLDNKEFI
jgi:[acyl-carrier-protein] S-malonyltransferase